MSQSDRIKYKRLSTVLADRNFNPVFDSGAYTNYKTFGLVNGINQNKFNPNDLDESKASVLDYFDVKLNNVMNNNGTTKCPKYLCGKYNTWPNRVPLASIYSNPRPQSYFYWENFMVCFGSIQGASITNLPNNRNAKKTGSLIEICDTQRMVRTYEY